MVFSMDRYHHGLDSYTVLPHCEDVVFNLHIKMSIANAHPAAGRQFLKRLIKHLWLCLRQT